MSRASNQNKRHQQRRQAKNRQQPSKAAPTITPSTRIHKDGGQTRSRKRRADWIKRREAERRAEAKKTLADTSAAAKPLVRGNLQRVMTRLGSGRSAISEISREATAGGVIYRINKYGGLEILLVADHFDRWTIPKGHIEDGETAQETAIREIGEEAGVHQLEPVCWLGKIHFRYRRENILVLMSTQIYLFKALGDTNDIQKEDWMNGIKWFSYDKAVDIIAYRDIAKLIRLGRRRLEQRGEIESRDERY